MTPPARAARPWLAWVLVGLAALVPFARGVFGGQSFYFRDLSGHFLPLREFVLDGLRRGEVRSWNPLVHEGEPLSAPPVSYPPDLLQVLMPDERGISLSLALHVPLAALTLLALARGLGLSSRSAAGGALVYALGGFSLSCLNLYVYIEALAWAPLVVLGLVRAAEGGRRAVAGAAVVVAMALSTTGVEIVLQSVLFGLVLGARRGGAGRWLRAASSVALGAGLCGATIGVMSSMLADSARGQGFPPDVVLAQSIHPLTFLQVVIGDFHGDLTNLTDRWWGQNFFPQGFPYILSLYLGATVLVVAAVAVRRGQAFGGRVALLALLAVLVCLGRYAGFQPLVEALPLLRKLRYPTKAFFTVHIAVALLTSIGLDALGARTDPGAWRRLAAWALGLGTLLAAAPGLPLIFPDTTGWFFRGVLPPEYASPLRMDYVHRILADAAAGGFLALAAGVLALLVLARRLEAPSAALAVTALMVTDLVRTGAALNPMVSQSFFRLSPEMAPVVSRIHSEGGRVFSCEPEFSATFHRSRETVPRSQDVWTFAAYGETLMPLHNMGARVPTAYSRDRTMLVPSHRVFSPAEVACASPPQLTGPLRRAGVAHVLSIDPLSAPELHLCEIIQPRRVAPLKIHVYGLERPLPLRGVARTVRRATSPAEAEAIASAPGFQEGGGVAVEGSVPDTDGATGRVLSVAEAADRIDMTVEADRPTVAVVRDAHAPGWSATVDGAPAPLLRADGRHRAVPIKAGRCHLTLSYRPPGLAPGLVVTAFSSCLALVLWVSGRRRPV